MKGAHQRDTPGNGFTRETAQLGMQYGGALPALVSGPEGRHASPGTAHTQKMRQALPPTSAVYPPVRFQILSGAAAELVNPQCQGPVLLKVQNIAAVATAAHQSAPMAAPCQARA